MTVCVSLLYIIVKFFSGELTVKRCIALLLVLLLSTLFAALASDLSGEDPGSKPDDPGTSAYCNHPSYNVIEIQASCTGSGAQMAICRECGAELTVDGYPVIIPAEGHDWSAWTEVISPTCTTDGTAKRICGVCGAIENETLPASHQWGEWQIVTMPTCVKNGERLHQCTVCFEYGDETIPATGVHRFNLDADTTVVSVKGTCESDGSYEAVCASCNAVFTCTGSDDDGTAVLKIPARGHSFDEGVITLQPTCLQDGEKICTCQNSEPTIEYAPCNDTLTVVVSKDELAWNDLVHATISKWHKLKEAVEIAPTATTRGIHYYYCTEAGCGYMSMQMTFTVEYAFTLPSAITAIEESALEGAALQSVYIPDTCESIGSCAFRDCAGLRYIRIPAGCAIGEDAFAGCENVIVFSAPGSPAQAYCSSHDNCDFVRE